MKNKFIKNVLDINNDAIRQIIHFTIKEMYDEIQPEGYAIIKFKLIDEFDITWDEIEANGGIENVNEKVRKKYNIEKW